jgi:anti-sigma B factor antagonist
MVVAKKIDDILVISFKNLNKLNILIAQAVKEDLAPYINIPNSNLILDLTGVEYIDSSGFGVLLSILRNSRRNNTNFKICNINDELMELIKLLKLQNIFDIYEDLDSCLQSFKEAAN